MDLVEISSVKHVLDHNLHIVGLVRVLGNDVVEDLVGDLLLAVLLGPRLVGTRFQVGLRQVAQQLSSAHDTLDIIIE